MKKFLLVLVIVAILAVPMVSLAQEEVSRVEKCTLSHDIKYRGDDYNKDEEICIATTTESPNCSTTDDAPAICIVDLIMTGGDWVFVIVLALAVLFILWGGVQILTSGGAEDKVKSGKTHITYALIGVAVAFLAKGLVKIIQMVLT